MSCKIQKRVEGGFAWAQPKLVVKRFTSGGWLDISPGGVVVSRGKCKTQTKPSLVEVWRAMVWHTLDENEPAIGAVGGFLKKLGKDGGNVPKRSRTFNAALREAGYPGRIFQQTKRQ